MKPNQSPNDPKDDPFSIFDQKQQHVKNQSNLYIDQRDQRSQNRIQNQYFIASDPTSLIALVNQNKTGELFQLRVLGAWFILSIITVLCGGGSIVASGSSVSLLSIVGLVLGIFFVYSSYGFIGIFIQGILHYQWRFRDVRNIWVVWFLYPLLSLFGIALWIVYWIIRFGPKLFGKIF